MAHFSCMPHRIARSRLRGYAVRTPNFSGLLSGRLVQQPPIPRPALPRCRLSLILNTASGYSQGASWHLRGMQLQLRSRAESALGPAASLQAVT